MGILTLTAAEKAANNVRIAALNGFTQLGRSGTNGFNYIWSNPDATPAEVLAALGTGAEKYLQLASLNIETLQAAAAITGETPPAIPTIPANYTLTFASDGSAILTDAEESSSSSSSSGH